MVLDKSPSTIIKMFNKVAPRYDLLNSVITPFTRQKTRIFALRLLNLDLKNKTMLDLATGTGDFAFLLYDNSERMSQVIGLDLSLEMLVIAKTRARYRGIKKGIKFLEGEATQLPFTNNAFDICTVSFSLRNFEKPQKAIKEIFRVIKRGGTLVIVEATAPIRPKFRFLHNFYFSRIVPLIARFLSPTPAAYHYLAQSIGTFPPAPIISEMLRKSGWKKIRFFSMFLGAATIFQGVKPYDSEYQ